MDNFVYSLGKLLEPGNQLRQKKVAFQKMGLYFNEIISNTIEGLDFLNEPIPETFNTFHRLL